MLKLDIDRYHRHLKTVHEAGFHELIIALARYRSGKKFWRTEELETDKFSKFRGTVGPARDRLSKLKVPLG